MLGLSVKPFVNQTTSTSIYRVVSSNRGWWHSKRTCDLFRKPLSVNSGRVQVHMKRLQRHFGLKIYLYCSIQYLAVSTYIFYERIIKIPFWLYSYFLLYLHIKLILIILPFSLTLILVLSISSGNMLIFLSMLQILLNKSLNDCINKNI